jgi:membrane protein YdbS with pleckstrin-like domain
LFYYRAVVGLVLFWAPAALVIGSMLAVFIHVWLGVFVGGVMALFALIATVWLPALSFSRWRYAVRGDDLLITRGVILRHLTSIPTHRVQHVDVQQGPLEQWLGLARVRIHTASGIGADGIIPGLKLDQAEILRDRLVRPSGNDGV